MVLETLSQVFDQPSNFIFGIGTDLVFIPRFYTLLSAHEEKFLKRAYHPKEIEQYATIEEEKKILYLASRWAIKESMFKAFGGTWRMPFTDIHVIKNSNGQDFFLSFSSFSKNIIYILGKPFIVAEGETLKKLNEFGIKSIQISLSHHEEYTTATVMLLKN